MSNESSKNNEIEELKSKIEDLESKYNKEVLLDSVVESLTKVFSNKDIIKNLLGLESNDTKSINNVQSISKITSVNMEEENSNESNYLDSFHESRNKLVLSLRNENEDLKYKLKALEKDNKDLNLDIENKDNEILEIKSEMKVLQHKLKGIEDRNDFLVVSKKNLEKKVESSEQKNKSLENLLLEEKEKHRVEMEIHKENSEKIKEEMNSEISSLKSNLNSIEEKYEEEKHKKEELEKEFFEEKRIYSLYLDLGSESKESLKGIFKNKGLKAFLSIISQYKSIESLFDFTQRCIMENKLDDLDSLKEIIKFALSKHNLIFNEPIYVMQNIKEGEMFDVDDESKTPSSNNAGVISKVYMQGYVNINLNKVVKKAVVEI